MQVDFEDDTQQDLNLKSDGRIRRHQTYRTDVSENNDENYRAF